MLATEGTVKSNSYTLEIAKLWPNLTVTGQACPFWVALVEYNEADSPGADYFVKKRIDQLMQHDPEIDTIILGCTHFPLLMPKILKYIKPSVRLVPQGEYVASSLQDYLQRHTDMEQRITRGGTARYFTSESPDKFKANASIFLRESIEAEHIELG